MRYPSKITGYLILASIFFTTGCNNDQETSPYDEILSQQPYASLTDSIKKEPKRDELYFRRAILLNQNNFPEPALADFQKAWSLKKEERYALGVSKILSDKKPDSAIQFLSNALKELPQSILLQLTLAKAYNSSGKSEDALNVCDKILQVFPDEVDALQLKSELLEKKNDTTGSIAALEKACALAPLNAEMNYDLAYKYADSKNPKTISFCDSLIKKDSAGIHAEPYYCKGIYYSNTNEKTKALDNFNAAIQHDYYFLNAYIEKGKIFFDQKKYAEAQKIFSLAFTLSSTFPDAYYWIGKCQEALGQKHEAKLNYQRAYGLDKTFREAKDAADRIKD